MGGLGPLLDPLLAVLGASWGLCCRSWAALGAYVRDLGTYVGGPGPLLAGPGLPLAEKWPWPEREGDLGKEPGPLAISVPRGILRIFSIDRERERERERVI